MERVVEALIGKLNNDLRSFDLDSIQGVKKVFKTAGTGSSSVLRIKIVEDTNPQFINLFGVNIDLISGDIALGLHILKSEYIKVGNIQDVIANVWFKGDKGLVSTLDLKYILELLKLDPVHYCQEIYEDLMFQINYWKV